MDIESNDNSNAVHAQRVAKGAKKGHTWFSRMTKAKKIILALLALLAVLAIALGVGLGVGLHKSNNNDNDNDND